MMRYTNNEIWYAEQRDKAVAERAAAIARAEAAEAEAARLRAVIDRKNHDHDEVFNDYEEMRRAWEAALADNAALRAQLDAAQFTYDTDPPVDAQIDAICHEVQMDARGTWWHGSNIIYPDGWRPAPPQE